MPSIYPHLGGLHKVPQASDEWTPWPFLDTLYDYTGFLDRGPIASPTATCQSKKIAIVGAGVSGLVTAYELMRAGFDVTLFEASDRVGGRCWSKDLGDGAIGEMGAMRVPLSHKTFWRYADQFDLKRSAFPDPGTAPTELYYKNQRFNWPAGQPNQPPGPFTEIQEGFGKAMSGFVEEITPAWKAGDLAQVRAIWQKYIDEYRLQTFYQGVALLTNWGKKEMDAFGALGIGSGGFEPMFGIDFITALRFVLQQYTGKQSQLQYGMGSFADALADSSFDGKTVRSRIQLRSKVSRIGYTQGQPVLQFSDNREALTFDAVVVAISTRAMDILGLTLPYRKQKKLLREGQSEGVRDMHMTASSKIFITTETKFWKNTDLPQCILTDELPRSVYCLDYPQTKKGVVLISYTWEDDSAVLMSLSPEEAFARCKRSLRAANPDFAKQLKPYRDKITKVDWTLEAGYHGGFQLPQPGQEPQLSAIYHQFLDVLDAQQDKGVILAGDGVSWQGGWTEGAVETGINAACAAAHRVGGLVSSGSPLSQNPHLYKYRVQPGLRSQLPPMRIR